MRISNFLARSGLFNSVDVEKYFKNHRKTNSLIKLANANLDNTKAFTRL